MARDRQLFKLTGDGFQTFDRLGEDDTLIFKPADNVPMLFWPDGQWCLEANVFMQQLYTKGLSRRDLGGTLKTYAARLRSSSDIAQKIERISGVSATTSLRYL